MQQENFERLAEGDIIEHKATKVIYQVMANYGTCVLATRVVQATNPEEWECVSRVTARGRYVKLP